MTKKGLIYMAVGSEGYLFGSLFSALSTRRNGFTDQISIVTDLDNKIFSILKHKHDILPIRIKKTKEGRLFSKSRPIKTQLYKYSLYQKTLYLDADTICVGNINNIWDHITATDMAAVNYETVGKIYRAKLDGKWGMVSIDLMKHMYETCPSDFPYFNSGAMAWNAGYDTKKMFDTWYKQWKMFSGKTDETTLACALFLSGIRYTELPPEYNRVTKDPKINHGDKILHYTHGCREPKNKTSPRLIRMSEFCEQIYPDIYQMLMPAFDKSIKIPSKSYRRWTPTIKTTIKQKRKIKPASAPITAFYFPDEIRPPGWEINK